MNPRVAELEPLRDDALSCVERVADTLIWFSDQFAKQGAIPRNIWAQLDRPLPRETGTLGLAFDVWHAMLRAEGALRNTRKKTADSLARQSETHRKALEKLLRDPKPNEHNLIVRLTADEIHGTFNAFSAAAILRSEVFPSRSAVTPSYLAGHILVAALRLAGRKAISHSADGIKERAPRVGVVADGVHSLMLYVDHLRDRAEEFERLAKQLVKVEQLESVCTRISGVPSTDRAEVEDAYVRIALANISPSCERCGQLLLSLRQFFKVLDAECCELLKTPALTTNSLLAALSRATAVSRNDKSMEGTQKDSYEFALLYAYNLYKTIERIKSSLDAVFGASSYDELTKGLRELAVAGARLARKHSGSFDFADGPPSILDSARFGFVEDLINTFSVIPFRRWLRQAQKEHSTRHRPLRSFFAPSTCVMLFRDEQGPDLKQRLENLLRRYGIEESASAEPHNVVRALGEAPIGKSVLRWWSNYAECYFSYQPEVLRAGSPKPRDHWLSLRHRSFLITQTVKSRLEDCQTLSSFGTVLLDGAQEYRALANEVHDMLKSLTQCCQTRGRNLLLAARTGPDPIDPNELVSALWIADRLNEPWPVSFEIEALRVLEGLQRKNGGFDPAEPLSQNRGFLFYASSARTLSSLARFVTKGRSTDGGYLLLRGRVTRWEKILASGTHFLANDFVSGRRFSGWRSDRHPEIGRIDCSATTEAVTALCRSIDAYRWLLNVEAANGFNTTWPADRMSKAVPADCNIGARQVLPQLMGIVRDLRHRTVRYSALWPTSGIPIAVRRSLLFYGPPGTGKTYFQSLIAAELNWPLIILSIGDFLADGEDKVAARTVQIFDQLKHLSNTCIVFDEFDEMVIRRSSKVGHSGFNLLTPTLLPLLADLRKHAEANNCLVTFTTNYVERLDRAAKRVGRVDEEFPLIYHDFISRFLVFLEIAKDIPSEFDWKLLEPTLLKTALCAFPEMRSVIEQFAKDPHKEPIELRRAIDCEFYIERLGDQKRDKQVIEEAALVVSSFGKEERNHRIPDWTQLYAILEEVKGLPPLAKSAATNK